MNSLYGTPATVEAALEDFDDGDDAVDEVEESWLRCGRWPERRYVKALDIMKTGGV